MIDTFKYDVDKGLSLNPKRLPSKYFYDQKGDALFVKIMNMPEYYLTRCELDIFKNKTQQLIEALNLKPKQYFELIELGAGDGLKTKELLKRLESQNFNFDYFPIDISSNILNHLKEDLELTLPKVSVKPRQGDYFDVLETFKQNKNPKVILFLGSNIGNMSDAQASQFIYNLGRNLQKGDTLLLGVDLIKPKEIVLPAYNDQQGITAAFNLNLLHRINKELGGSFNLKQFIHQPEYNEQEGIAKSYIVSTTKQTVEIKAIGKHFDFLEGEKIHTEISRKYNDKLIQKIISPTDFRLKTKIMDSKSYFADYILTKQ